MKRRVVVGGAMALLVSMAATPARAEHDAARPLVVVTTNDAAANEIKVYDGVSHALLQTLPTHGKGGVAGNARGVRQYEGRLFAAVNFGSGTVSIFRRVDDRLKYEGSVATSSAPISVDFGNDHMYVAGSSTVDSFTLRGNGVGWNDGTTTLELAGGGAPPAGSTAQIGVLDRSHLLVTLKTDPTPGTVDVVALNHGAVSGVPPQAVSAPAGSLTPFGFSVYRDGTALITLAHSNQDAIFRNGAFVAVAAATQAADCWSTRVGKYVFTANTGSRTISRVVGTGNNVFIDAQVAASIPTGGPSDIDAEAGVMAVVDHAAGVSHLTLLTYNPFGELAVSGGAIDLGAANANGVAVIPGRDSDD